MVRTNWDVGMSRDMSPICTCARPLDLMCPLGVEPVDGSMSLGGDGGCVRFCVWDVCVACAVWCGVVVRAGGAMFVCVRVLVLCLAVARVCVGGGGGWLRVCCCAVTLPGRLPTGFGMLVGFWGSEHGLFVRRTTGRTFGRMYSAVGGMLPPC